MTVMTPRVLVVSESRITRRVVEMTFADQPVELVVATSGQAGLDAWTAHGAAVVLADVSMEAPNGMAVARHVQATAAGRRCGVLLMAGLNDTVDAGAAADADVRGTLRKPLDSLQLIEAVREVLQSARPPRAPQAHVPAAAEAPPVAAAATDMSPLADAPPAPQAEAPVAPLALTFAVEPVAGVAGVHDGTGPAALAAADLERVAARVVARVADMTVASAAAAAERLAPAAASEAAERLVREMAPALVQQVARLVVADVSERLVREEIARMRSAHLPR